MSSRCQRWTLENSAGLVEFFAGNPVGAKSSLVEPPARTTQSQSFPGPTNHRTSLVCAPVEPAIWVCPSAVWRWAVALATAFEIS